jgi:hypothetical protein
MSDRDVFFVDFHYYTAKATTEYTGDIIASPPSLTKFEPHARIPMEDVGYGAKTDDGLKAVEDGDTSYFTEDAWDDAALPGLQFLAPQLSFGDAVISPDGTVFILVDPEDVRQEMEVRKRCMAERACMGRLFPILHIDDDTCAVIVSGNDREVKAWVEGNYPK